VKPFAIRRRIRGPGRLDIDLFSSRSRSALALASGGCDRGLALLRRGPLEIKISRDGRETSVHRLGPDLTAGSARSVLFRRMNGKAR